MPGTSYDLQSEYPKIDKSRKYKLFDMKKLLFVFIAVTLLVSCKKDEDNGPVNNIKYNNVTYELGKGYLENYGIINDDLYSFDLWLVSDEILVTESNISGVGNIIYVGFISSSATDLAAGTYTFSASQSSAFSFYFGFVGLDYDVANQNGTQLSLVGGTIVVAKSGAEYEITLNGVLVSGKSVTAYYKGTLTVYDFTS